MTFIPNISGVVSTNNSTSTPLSIGGTFTGIADIVDKYASVTLSCYSDKSSSPSGLQLQFSSNGTDWDVIRSFSYLLTVKYTSTIIITSKFARIIYTNGSSAQTSFRLQIVYHISKAAVDSPQSTAFTPSLVDAFGRLRTSNPFTIIDISYVRDINDYHETQAVTGTGAITINANAPIVTLAVTAGTGSAIKQSRQRGIYQPGKSLLIYITGIINGSGANGVGVTSRLGYFDQDNGQFFSHVGNGGTGTLYVNERSSCNGSIVTTSIAQNSWNIDKMDGTGNSGITIDNTKTLIFTMDLEWLGVGIVRYGFVIGGVVHYCHNYYHSNFFNLPYMQVASLPIRGEIITTSGAGTLHRVCGTVISEGGFTANGRKFSVIRQLADSVSVAAGISFPLISIQLKSTSNNPKINVYPTGISILNEGNRNVRWYLAIFRDLASATVLQGPTTWVSANPLSAIEYDISSTSMISFPDNINQKLIIITTGCISASSSTNISIPTQGNNPAMITTNLAGQSSILCVVVVSTGNTNLSAAIEFNELY